MLTWCASSIQAGKSRTSGAGSPTHSVTTAHSSCDTHSSTRRCCIWDSLPSPFTLLLTSLRYSNAWSHDLIVGGSGRNASASLSEWVYVLGCVEVAAGCSGEDVGRGGERISSHGAFSLSSRSRVFGHVSLRSSCRVKSWVFPAHFTHSGLSRTAC